MFCNMRVQNCAFFLKKAKITLGFLSPIYNRCLFGCIDECEYMPGKRKNVENGLAYRSHEVFSIRKNFRGGVKKNEKIL